MGVLAFALTVLCWPPWYSPATAPRWALLAVIIPALLVMRPLEWRTAPFVLLGIAALSLLWTSNLFNGLDILFKFSLLAGVIALARPQDTPDVMAGMGYGLTLNAVLLVAQRYAEGKLGSSALFFNPNFLAEAAAPVFVGLLCLGRPWLAIGPAVCLAFTGTRGALVGVAAAGVAYLWTRSRALAALLILCVVVAALGILATGYRLESVAIRVVVWREALGNLTLFGHGLGSAYADFPFAKHLHNDALELVYELGIGSIAFFGMLVLAFQVNLLAERLVLVTILAEGCFGFPLHMPTTGFLLACVAGVLLHQRTAVRAYIFDGRSVLPSGSAAFGSVRRRAF